MGPKSAPAPVKGQKSLFSFFKKPNTVTVSPPASESKSTEKVTPISKADDVPLQNSLKEKLEKNDTVEESVLALKKRKIESNNAPECNNKNKKAPNAVVSSSKPVKRKGVIDEEDEWDENEGAKMDEDQVESEASGSFVGSDEESFEDEDDEESDGDSDSLCDSDDSGAAPKAAKKQKHSRLSKGPTKNSASKPTTTSSSAINVTSATKPPAGRSRPASTPASTAKVTTKPSPQFSITPYSKSSSAPSSGSDSKSSGATPMMVMHMNTITPGSTKRKDREIDSPTEEVGLPEGVYGAGNHDHDTCDFLKPANIRDKDKNRPDHPAYNPRSVYVPVDFLQKQTPGMKQWWLLKAVNMDTVLFFKVGKFYELFHMDADVGFAEIDLIYMKGTKGHSGFPEVSYGKFASTLVSKGYKVARVEQTETPDMLKERNDAKGGKKDQVVARELCSIMSKGTRTYCHLDDLSLLEGDAELSSSASLLMCITEKLVMKEKVDVTSSDDSISAVNPSSIDQEEAVSEYGVCCVDTVIGSVTLAQFEDDEQRSRLRAMMARYSPNEVLLEANAHSSQTVGVVRLLAHKASIDLLRGREEIPSGRDTIDQLDEGRYYLDKFKKQHYPAVVEAVRDGLKDGSSELVLSAMGGVLWHLKRALIDYEILSMGNVYAYVPPDVFNSHIEDYHNDNADASQPKGVQCSTPSAPSSSSIFTAAITKDSRCLAMTSAGCDAFDETGEQMEGGSSSSSSAGAFAQGSVPLSMQPKSMVLDEVALTNLEVLVNNHDRKENGSLWAFINRTKTAFGRRLLHKWLCNPLYRAGDIMKRGEAVEELLTGYPEESEAARRLLKGVPDLERLLIRVHSNGLKKKGGDQVDHPDSRAVMYEMPIYNARKIRDFADVLSGFEQVLKTAELFESQNRPFASTLLQLALKARPVSGQDQKKFQANEGRFPFAEMRKLLQQYREIFDEKQAKKDGNIKPRAGIDPDYDQGKADVKRIETDLQEYLREMKRKTGMNDINFWGTNKDRYQMEVPIGQANKVPSDWTSKSQKKTHRRYWSPVIVSKLEQLVAAEEAVGAAQKDTLRRIFEKFDSNRSVWGDALSCVSLLDALLALSSVSAQPGYVWPTVLNKTETGPQLSIKAGRHPMLEFALSQRGDGEYIPNDLSLGGSTTRRRSRPATKEGAPGASQEEEEFRPKMLLLSGPNMGGKSTLLRQTCLITILAQIGCKVPADSVVMTPVDRIFTRVGASDKILAGQSTFYVELAETAAILKWASEDSLCILDELGRGTATFDGTAIAHSVVEFLVRKTRCRSVFATHYHSLVDDWEIDPRVRLGHMDCIVGDGGSNIGMDGVGEEMNIVSQQPQGDEEVTFLYKLCDGSSPRSYGINVARLAGLPQYVLDLALLQSRAFEDKTKAEAAAFSHAHHSLEDDERDDEQRVGVSRQLLHREKVSSVYDCLVSMSHSDPRMSAQEFTFVIKEMWRRCTKSKVLE
jgi:DNA mismatch repair protein MSH6